MDCNKCHRHKRHQGRCLVDSHARLKSTPTAIDACSLRLFTKFFLSLMLLYQPTQSHRSFVGILRLFDEFQRAQRLLFAIDRVQSCAHRLLSSVATCEDHILRGQTKIGCNERSCAHFCTPTQRQSKCKRWRKCESGACKSSPAAAQCCWVGSEKAKFDRRALGSCQLISSRRHITLCLSQPPRGVTCAQCQHSRILAVEVDKKGWCVLGGDCTL